MKISPAYFEILEQQGSSIYREVLKDVLKDEFSDKSDMELHRDRRVYEQSLEKLLSSDKALPGQARLEVDGYGRGTYQSFSKNTLGANDHTIRFDDGATRELKLKRENCHVSDLVGKEAKWVDLTIRVMDGSRRGRELGVLCEVDTITTYQLKLNILQMINRGVAHDPNRGGDYSRFFLPGKPDTPKDFLRNAKPEEFALSVKKESVKGGTVNDINRLKNDMTLRDQMNFTADGRGYIYVSREVTPWYWKTDEEPELWMLYPLRHCFSLESEYESLLAASDGEKIVPVGAGRSVQLRREGGGAIQTFQFTDAQLPVDERGWAGKEAGYGGRKVKREPQPQPKPEPEPEPEPAGGGAQKKKKKKSRRRKKSSRRRSKNASKKRTRRRRRS